MGRHQAKRGSLKKLSEVIMKKSLYSIRDEVAEEFGEPFMAVNDNVARRCYLLGFRR